MLKEICKIAKSDNNDVQNKSVFLLLVVLVLLFYENSQNKIFFIERKKTEKILYDPIKTRQIFVYRFYFFYFVQ